MRRGILTSVLIAVLVYGWIAHAQSRGGNWPTHGGDAQRSGWEAADASINRDSVKNLQLLWKVKLETAANNSLWPVMPPLILNRLISYRGFKELAFVGTNADIVYAIDADLGKIFWTRHLEYSVREPQATTSTWACPGGMTASPTMPVAGSRGAAAGRGAPAAGGGRGNPFIGGAASVYAIGSDGRLHRLNTSTGDDMTQPVSVIPANSRASHLLMVDNVIYTTTTNDCNGTPNAVWAVDLNGDAPKTRSFGIANGALGGVLMGGDGMIYVKNTPRESAPPHLANSRMQALTARELEPRNPLPLAPEVAEDRSSVVAFNYKNRDLLVAQCGDWLCLKDIAQPTLDSTLPPPHPPLNSPKPRVGSVNRRTVGQPSTWQDSDGTRWVLTAVLGPLPDWAVATNGPATSGFILASKVVDDQNGWPTLTPIWASRNMDSPQSPVVANGVVFALAAGEFTRRTISPDSIEEKPRAGTRAILYALDARTGKELYSSRNLITGPASFTGLTVTTGRVYFGGLDGTLYAFGMYMEH
jgi:outer membrane protein assembly factor BamB